MSTYKERAIVLENKIVAYDYYQQLYCDCLKNRKLADLRDNDICDLMNNFWAALPDSPATHRYPFYQLCNLCESPEEELPYDPDC